MSDLYLLNLGFSMSTSAFANGNFDLFNSGSSGLNQSCAWYKYQGSGMSLNDDFYLLSQNLSSGDWSSLGSDASALNTVAGDFCLVRIYPSDSTPPANCRLRFSAVFGRGSHTAPSGSTPALQSPLQIVQGSNTTARPVLVTDATAETSWAVSPTGNNVWTYCLGKIHGADNTYTVNVGATVLNPNTQLLVAYGHDPTMKVGGG